MILVIVEALAVVGSCHSPQPEGPSPHRTIQRIVTGHCCFMVPSYMAASKNQGALILTPSQQHSPIYGNSHVCAAARFLHRLPNTIHTSQNHSVHMASRKSPEMHLREVVQLM